MGADIETTEESTEALDEGSTGNTTPKGQDKNSMPKYVIGIIVAGVVIAMGGVAVLVIVIKGKLGVHNND